MPLFVSICGCIPDNWSVLQYAADLILPRTVASELFFCKLFCENMCCHSVGVCACVSVFVTLKQQAPYCPSSVYGNYGFYTFSAQEASRPERFKRFIG